MDGPFETAAPYDAPRDGADRWQAPIANVGVLSNETQSDLSRVLGSMQQQPVMQHLEQQQQMRRSDEASMTVMQEEPLTPEQAKKKFERALAWVKLNEPDRLW